MSKVPTNRCENCADWYQYVAKTSTGGKRFYGIGFCEKHYEDYEDYEYDDTCTQWSPRKKMVDADKLPKEVDPSQMTKEEVAKHSDLELENGRLVAKSEVDLGDMTQEENRVEDQVICLYCKIPMDIVTERLNLRVCRRCKAEWRGWKGPVEERPKCSECEASATHVADYGRKKLCDRCWFEYEVKKQRGEVWEAKVPEKRCENCLKWKLITKRKGNALCKFWNDVRHESDTCTAWDEIDADHKLERCMECGKFPDRVHIVDYGRKQLCDGCCISFLQKKLNKESEMIEKQCSTCREWERHETDAVKDSDGWCRVHSSVRNEDRTCFAWSSKLELWKKRTCGSCESFGWDERHRAGNCLKKQRPIAQSAGDLKPETDACPLWAEKSTSKAKEWFICSLRECKSYDVGRNTCKKEVLRSKGKLFSKCMWFEKKTCGECTSWKRLEPLGDEPLHSGVCKEIEATTAEGYGCEKWTQKTAEWKSQVCGSCQKFGTDVYPLGSCVKIPSEGPVSAVTRACEFWDPGKSLKPGRGIIQKAIEGLTEICQRCGTEVLIEDYDAMSSHCLECWEQDNPDKKSLIRLKKRVEALEKEAQETIETFKKVNTELAKLILGSGVKDENNS
jgi:hypothetical protein